MLNRNKTFSEYGVRDLAGYNSLCVGDPELEKMPQIVIFIDEFADLMMAASGDVESSVCRLAQMGRAAGIHLVIATQRPSVDVITGLIKANIPSRIALRVASQIDSRTIIDSAGSAEKLLGKGDMLFNPVGAPKPLRVQGCWVSEKEVERTVDFIKKSFVLDYDESVIKEIEENAELVGLSKSDREKKSAEIGELDLSDDKLDEAIDAVIDAGQASTSYLQRKLKLGYGRAARLIDIMEQMGVVGTFEGSKPRQVIMTRQEWLERKVNKGD
jgi:S-DNA-T family DNA segregation ATPase FtsK/SpoIIIE